MLLRRALTASLFLLLACSGSDNNASPGGGTPDSGTSPESDGSTSEPTDGGTSKDDGGTSAFPLVKARPYATKVPAKYDATKPTPLVVLLHGYGASAKVQDDYFGLSALAETEGFLLALPDGTTDLTGKRFWNATSACCNFANVAVDDKAYLGEVIKDMKARFNVDPKRVHLIGHSNGGFMANSLACAASTEIAGIVSLAGANHNDAALCTPTDPVAVLQVHGTADETVSYEGGVFFSGGATYPSAKQTVATWAAKNGCEATLTTAADTLDLESTLAGSETTVARHTCTKGAAELWTITAGKHIPTFQSTWAKQIYDFLKAHPKP